MLRRTEAIVEVNWLGPLAGDREFETQWQATDVLKLRDLGFDVCVIDEDTRSVSPLTDDYLRQIADRPPGWFANLYCTKGLPNPCQA